MTDGLHLLYNNGTMRSLRDVEERLKEFVSETEGVVGVVLATPEGLTYSYYSDRAFDPDTISALVASMFSLVKRIGRAAGLELPKEMSVHLEEGSLHIFPIGELVVGVEALPGVMTGMVLVSTRRMLEDLKSIGEGVIWT